MLPKSKNNDCNLKKTWERQEKLVLLSCAINIMKNPKPKPDDGFFRSSDHFTKKGQSRWNTKPVLNLNTCLLSGFTVWSHYPHQDCHLSSASWSTLRLWPLTSCQVNRSRSSSCKGINTEFKLNIDYDMTMTKSEKLSFSWNINSAVCFYLNECCLICNPQKIWVKFYRNSFGLIVHL